MNRLIIISTIIILIIALSICGIFYARQTKILYEKMVHEAKLLCAEKKAEELTQLTEKMINIWEKRQTLLSFYIRHEDLETMLTSLISLKGHIQNENFANANITLYKIEYLAKHIYELELPNLDNLF